MKTTRRFLLAAISIAITFTLFSCSSENPAGGNNNNEVAKLYCDSQYGNGCFEISNASECDTQWGKVTNTCSDNPTPTPSSGSVEPTPPPPSSSSSSPGIEQCDGYCKWPDGCFRIATDPTGQYGSVVSSCTVAISNCRTNGQFFNNSTCSGSTPSSSSVVTPNALVVTLTAYKELKTLDAGGYGDPRISFRVRSFLRGVANPLTDSTTKLLLNRDDIYEWSGTASDTVAIHTSADSVLVNPIVKETDVLSDDDYSPSGRYVTGPFTNGSAYNVVDNEDTGHYIRITYSLKFIKK